MMCMERANQYGVFLISSQSGDHFSWFAEAPIHVFIEKKAGVLSHKRPQVYNPVEKNIW